MPQTLTVVYFQRCCMKLSGSLIETTFDDGTHNEMHRSGVDTDNQRSVAQWAGYGDNWWLYTCHHDLTHAWFAEAIGWPYSMALHDSEPVDISQASEDMKWEEHCVNRLQRQLRTGEADEYGCLQDQFGDTLPARLDELRKVLRAAELVS